MILLAGCRLTMPRVMAPEAWLEDPDRVDAALVDKLAGEGYRSLLLEISRGDGREAAELASRAGLRVGAWITVGRDPKAVAAHPEWMNVPRHMDMTGDLPGKVWPWVSIDNVDVFEYEFQRVVELVEEADWAEVIYLSELQAGPAGCGCGSLLCKSWDNSPGKKISGGNPYDSGHVPVQVSKFMYDLREKFRKTRFVPVLTSECESGVTVCGVRDPERKGGFGTMDCTVPCATRTFPRLVDTLKGEGRIGLLCLAKEFGRNIPLYGEEYAWVRGNVERLRGLDAPPIVAVVQGWDVPPREILKQVDRAREGGAVDVIVAGVRLPQDWEPR